MRHRFQIPLPHMSADQIIDLLDFLEGLVNGIWREHGDDLASHPRLGGISYPPDWSDSYDRADDDD